MSEKVETTARHMNAIKVIVVKLLLASSCFPSPIFLEQTAAAPDANTNTTASVIIMYGNSMFMDESAFVPT